MTVAPYHIGDRASLFVGDCREWLATLPENSIDAWVTDPPYELAFMGKKWDGSGIAHDREMWALVLRALKPGGHLVAFAGDRTYHRLACAIEDAGFEIRHTISWCYFSGFPKSLDVSKALDSRPGVSQHQGFSKHLRERRELLGLSRADVDVRTVGAKTGACWHWENEQFPRAKWWPALRELLGLDPAWGEVLANADREKIDEKSGSALAVAPGEGRDRSSVTLDITAPATLDAVRWSGWGTALKPAVEPMVLARKPLSERTVAANVLRWGTGALNIDGCRFAPGDPAWVGPNDDMNERRESWLRGGNDAKDASWQGPPRHEGSVADRVSDLGRFPANLYYCPKASRRERERGCDGLPARSGAEAVDREEGSAGTRSPRAGAGRTAKEVRNNHPTVKPIEIMRWLARLITPPGGTIGEGFMGSGSTGVAAVLEGFRIVGSELQPEYAQIAEARIGHALAHPETWKETAPGARAKTPKPEPIAKPAATPIGQLGLLKS